MLPKFELHIPASIEEACRLKNELQGEVVAGGSDVYAKMHQEDHQPENIIDLKQIREMQGISFDPETGLDLGALATHHEISTSKHIRELYPVLVEGVMTIGSLQVRNRGTIGGNVCTAAPSADGIGPLLVMRAECVVQGLNGVRTVDLENFFTGPKQTVLGKDEILTRIKLPPVKGRYGSRYFKYGRRNAMEIALLGISVYVETMEDGYSCNDIRIALGTSAPTPIRVHETEAFLKGKDLRSGKVLQEAGEIVLKEASPRSSWRSSAEFRKDLLVKLVPRTIKEAYLRIDQAVR